MIRNYIILVVLLILMPFSLKADEIRYKSELIAHLVSESGCQVESALCNRADTVGMIDGLPVKAIFDKDSVLTNIGIALFNEDEKKDHPVVYNFIERYFLEILTEKQTNTTWKIKDDNVLFTKGSPFDISEVNGLTPYSLNRFGDDYYEIVWTIDSDVELAMRFPMKFELLLGMPQIELEKYIEEEYASDSLSTTRNNNVKLMQISDSVWTTVPIKNYFVNSVSDATYYVKDSVGNISPFYDTLSLEFSLANLFHGLVDSEREMQITQRLYGNKEKQFTLKISNFVNNCHKNNMTIYFGIEGEDESFYKVLLICENKDLGYNHLFSVLVQKDFITNPESPIYAKFDAYIPTHNVKNLYEEK